MNSMLNFAKVAKYVLSALGNPEASTRKTSTCVALPVLFSRVVLRECGPRFRERGGMVVNLLLFSR